MTYVELVNGAAKARGESELPPKWITEALRRISAGEEQVERYPGGEPSLKDVYSVAARLALSEVN